MERSAGLNRVHDGSDVVMDDVIDMEREKRRRFIAELRESNNAARAELDREIVERAHNRPIESPMDRDRRELAEFHQRLAEQREHEPARTARAPAAGIDSAEVDRRIRAAVLMVSREIASTLKQDGRALNSELRDLRTMLAETLKSFTKLSELVEDDSRGKSKGGEIIDITPVSRRN